MRPERLQHSACARLSALCACGPLGLVADGDSAALRAWAGLLLGAVHRTGDRLRVWPGTAETVELLAVPETDWLAWERLCGRVPARRCGEGAGGGRRLLCFRAGTGPWPEVCEAPPRCAWTRGWLAAPRRPVGLSAAATPTAPPAAW